MEDTLAPASSCEGGNDEAGPTNAGADGNAEEQPKSGPAEKKMPRPRSQPTDREMPRAKRSQPPHVVCAKTENCGPNDEDNDDELPLLPKSSASGDHEDAAFLAELDALMGRIGEQPATESAKDGEETRRTPMPRARP